MSRRRVRLGSTLSKGAAVGAITRAVMGGVIGLVVGLQADPRTAWFAIFEAGIPATFVGTLLGLAGGAIAWIFNCAATASPER